VSFRVRSLDPSPKTSSLVLTHTLHFSFPPLFLSFSSYLRRLQEAAAAAAAKGPDGGAIEASPVSTNGTPAGLAVPGGSTTSPANTFLEPSLSPASPLNTGAIPPSRYPIAADGGFHPSFPPLGGAFGAPQPTPSANGPLALPGSHRSASNPTDPSAYGNHAASPAGESYSAYPLHNWAYKQQQPHSAWPAPSGPIPPLSYCYRPHRLEDVAPRDTISLIIALFFDFVYPLTPCIHKPSFMADLHSRREERDPMFFALVMSTVASTLVQVPRSYVPLDRAAVRKLAQTCYEASRHISVVSYDPPTSMHVVVRYL
jgi:hypothetical protein